MNPADPNRTTPREHIAIVTRVQEEQERERLVAGLTVPGFDIEAVLGRGGMGVVYKAKQSGLNRTVALKMLLAGPFASPALRARFLLEAESVAALDHPHIVKVFAFGESGDHPYLAMEFAPGGSLSDRLRAGGPLPSAEAAAVLLKLAGAVAHAHSRGVVHRDIKPLNVLIGADGEPRLTDFGLAKATRADRHLSVSGQVLGTPAYMAPEQAKGRVNEIGTAADVYALGALLYDLLTGRPPFQGDSAALTLQKVLTEEPQRPRALNPSVPPDLETICLKCLEKEPRKRYATAQELADDAARWLRGEPIAARPAGALERAAKWVRRNRAVALAGAAVVLALLVGTVVSVAFGLEARRQQKDAENAASREEQEKRDAVVARVQAETNLREAVKTTASFVALASELEDTLWGQTGLTLRLLERTHTNLARLRTLGDSPEAREQLAALQTLAAKLHLLRGRTDLALPAANEAVAGYDALRAAGTAETRAGFWLALFTRARVHVDRGTTGPARADAQRALAAADELVAADPAATAHKVLQARAHTLLGAIEWARGRFPEGDAHHARALELLTAVAGAPGEVPSATRRLLARAHYNRGAALDRRNEVGATDEYRVADELLARIMAGAPAIQTDRIDALVARATPAHQSGDTTRATSYLDTAERLVDGLLQIDPDNGEWRRLKFYVGITRTQLFPSKSDAGRALRDQVVLFDSMIPVCERFVRDDPANATWRLRLVVLRRSAALAALSGATEPAARRRARATFDELLAEGRRLVALDPDHFSALQSFTSTGQVGLFVLSQSGEKRTPDTIRAVYRPTFEFYARRLREEPNRAEWRTATAEARYQALQLYVSEGHFVEWEAEAAAGLDDLKGVPDAPAVAVLRGQFAWYMGQARLAKRPADPPGAVEAFRTAADALEPWVLDRPDEPERRKLWSDAATALAVALSAADRPAEAARARDRARAVRLQIAEGQLARKEFLPRPPALLSDAAVRRIATASDAQLATQAVAAAERALLLGRTPDRTLDLVETCLVAAASTDATDPAHGEAVRRYLLKIADAYDKLTGSGPLSEAEGRLVRAVRAALDDLDRTAPPPRAKP